MGDNFSHQLEMVCDEAQIPTDEAERAAVVGQLATALEQMIVGKDGQAGLSLLLKRALEYGMPGAVVTGIVFAVIGSPANLCVLFNSVFKNGTAPLRLKVKGICFEMKVAVGLAITSVVAGAFFDALATTAYLLGPAHVRTEALKQVVLQLLRELGPQQPFLAFPAAAQPAGLAPPAAPAMGTGRRVVLVTAGVAAAGAVATAAAVATGLFAAPAAGGALLASGGSVLGPIVSPSSASLAT